LLKDDVGNAPSVVLDEPDVLKPLVCEDAAIIFVVLESSRLGWDVDLASYNVLELNTELVSAANVNLEVVERVRLDSAVDNTNIICAVDRDRLDDGEDSSLVEL
jgi:hypothetical protein